MLEIRNTEQIVRNGWSIRPHMHREDYFKTQWISVESLIRDIEVSADKGNLVNEKGFSAGLYLSDLLSRLRGSLDNSN